MSAAPTRPLLRYHGGKWKLAPWIISHFPAHGVYVESFGGGGSVLLAKARSDGEVYNDLDGEIVNLFRVCRDYGAALVRAVELTPFARGEFDLSFQLAKSPVERARRTVVRSLMGFGGNLTRYNRDQTPQRTGWRRFTRTRYKRGDVSRDWRNWPLGIPAVIERLQGVIIENQDAVKVIEQTDAADTLHYVDPPYVHATRGFDAGGTHRGYRFEMTDDDHRALAAVLKAAKGKVILSGYPCELYDRELYSDWNRRERKHLADGARPRTEVVWMNYDPPQGQLFQLENQQIPVHRENDGN